MVVWGVGKLYRCTNRGQVVAVVLMPSGGAGRPGWGHMAGRAAMTHCYGGRVLVPTHHVAARVDRALAACKQL